MTTQIFIGNGYGLAVATDSAVTVGNRRTYETSEKLICVTEPHAVAILVSGAVTQFGLPMQVIIREWIDGLGSQRLRKLSDYRDSFIDWLRDSSTDFPNPARLAEDAFRSVDNNLYWWWKASSGDERHESIEDRTAAALEYFEHWLEQHRSFERVDHFDEMGGPNEALRIINELWVEMPDRWPGLEQRVEVWFDDIDPSQLSTLKELIREFLVERLSSWTLLGDNTRVAIAGYGDKELVPSVAEVMVFGSYGNWVSTFSFDPQQASMTDNGYFLLRPIGQTDYIDNILRGYRADFIESAVGALRQANTGAHEPEVNIEGEVSPTNTAEQSIAGPEQTAPDVEEMLWSAVYGESEERLLVPLRQAVAAMPIRSLAEAARSLVGVQILGNAISTQLPTSGGAIEVATITRSGGVQLH